MIENFASFYLPGYAKTLVYMLQRTEYEVGAYLKWYWRAKNFKKVIYRGSLVYTAKARALLLFLRLGIGLQIIIGAWLLILGIADKSYGFFAYGVCILVAYPIVWAFLITVPLLAGRWLIVGPKEKRLIAKSHQIFGSTKATKIAVAGSYGKTTMKELLGAVLSGGDKKVAITPANKNVSFSHAEFAASLKGDEDILVIEFGEGKPDDVGNFTKTVKPNLAVITGLAPAHLDHYPSLESAGTDIFSVSDDVKGSDVYVNGESEAVGHFIKKSFQVYGREGVGKWEVSNVGVGFSGTSFTLSNGAKSLELKSGLLGRHQIGPLSCVAIIALSLGLSKSQVEEAVAQTMPFEHRMQPRQVSGAWVIDDTYNGNIEGLRAGLELMVELPANKKIYVTPGLVDQGVETQRVHELLGKLIAQANPDQVVLIANSVCEYIKTGIEDSGYEGEVRIETDPLNYYSNIEQLLATGDLLVMQNDWPDNYY